MAIHHRLIILGSGPAGCTAAIYAARANLSPAIITGLEQGGQLTKTHQIDNWPGEINGVAGMELMDKMLKHTQRFDSKIISENIISADLKQRPLLLQGENDAYSCDALIIATGASAKYLGLSTEKQFIGKGVSACAVCDGFFYRGADVAVVGGGNTALEDALYLAKIARTVYLVHRRDAFRAEPFLVEQAKNCSNIVFELNQIPEEVLGDAKGVTALCSKNITTGELKKLDVKGIFVAIGHKPNTDIFIDQLAMEHGSIIVKSGTQGSATATNIPGVFAAGDVADTIYRQAITSAGTGCMAALDAKKYLDGLK